MTMATDYNNRLITPDLEKSMKDYPLYSQDSKKKDALCIAVFFIGNGVPTIGFTHPCHFLDKVLF